jgi:hypothetical protein
MFLPTTKTGVVSMINIRAKKLCKNTERKKKEREGGRAEKADTKQKLGEL